MVKRDWNIFSVESIWKELLHNENVYCIVLKKNILDLYDKAILYIKSILI